MFADGVKHATGVHQSSTIEVQSSDCCSSSLCYAEYQSEVFAPSEVLIPRLSTWMKQGRERAGHRIRSCGSRCFVLVATVAAECKIIGASRSVKANWFDVIDGKRIWRVAGLSPAVFAGMPAAFSYQAT